ncbi:transient-receptor-potential-like protein isoform X2 [Daphnia carinata]|uniref:transient-receptor-potential-like protein isoform X2 n=1 Tax=Daphnia carinata TaxID=120202 RepID=UPI00257F4ED0|nr:transient-receptor-potential-like protein isoform X2 [Daphnia carinata]
MEKPPNDMVPQFDSVEEGCIRTESFRDLKMPILPKSLTLEEKKFLLAVERGDLATVKRIIHRVKRGFYGNSINLDCMDPLGRGALLMAIDNENLQMVELLVVMGVATRDALLHAIDKEFVEAVELLLEHEELIHKEGEPYSWENVDRTTSSFTPDITPLILAAHRNNYEILKILLDRGATVPIPHDVQCGCSDCIRGVLEDSLRHSMSRINAYRALSSPSLIALSSNDPILSAFELSGELKRLAYMETEFRQEYMDLRRQCQQFACDLLSHTRSSSELAFLLNHDPSNTARRSSSTDDYQELKLTRLELAIEQKQKKFVAHPNIQQLLAAIWYEGLPGFRRKSALDKVAEITLVALLFPLYCGLYMIAPLSSYAQLMQKPFMKFLIHASSYLFFLFLLILVSQRFDVLVIQLLGTEAMRRDLEDQLRRQRGNGPTFLECFVAVYVLGYVYEEIYEMWKTGVGRYIRNLWNVIDVCRDLSYLLAMGLRVVAYIQQQQEIEENPAAAYIPREEWDDFDPQLVAEGVFAMANIFSALKLVHLFSINPYLGPLQISLGRMVIDIVKFFFIYTLVLFAFACGMNQLLWYFSDLEKKKCYTLPGGLPDWNKNPDACAKWRRFANLFESSQSLFWASFGLVDLGNFELAGVKSYTRFWGMLIFGAYSVINVVVLLNLLIAMMSNSYSLITEHSDTEWKFARSKLWMSYFDATGHTLPPPFNLLPTPKKIMRLFCRKSNASNPKLRRTSTKGRHASERDYCYTAVMRSLVWRYVTAMHRQQEMSQVTEDDVNEVKGDISTLRFELLDVFKNNGMDISSANKNTKAALGRKMRIWERRLLRDFHVVSVAGADEEVDQESPSTDGMGITRSLSSGGNEAKVNGADRFRKLASVAVAMNAAGLTQGITAGQGRTIKPLSQIGRSMSNESFKSSQNLRKAMEEAQRLTVVAPTPEPSPQHGKYSPDMALVADSGSSVLQLLRSMSEQEDEEEEDCEDNEQKPKEFKFFSANKKVNQFPTPTVTVSQTSSSHPGKQNEVKGSSSIMESNSKQLRSIKKAPSPPLPDTKSSNTASAIETPNSQSITALLTKMETKPLQSNGLSENKVTVESEVQRLDTNPTNVGASGPTLSAVNKESSVPMTGQDISYATTVSNAEATLTDDTPPSNCANAATKSVPVTLPKEQPPIVMPDPVVADRKLVIQSQNASAMPSTGVQPNSPNAEEKKNPADAKTVKRENSKGWF